MRDDVRFDQLVPALPLRERVYQALQRLIIDGGLAPGLHLVEDDLAKQLGVSRNPVREALQRLEHDGFVDRLSGRGAFVHIPAPHEVEELFHVRTLLESECARLAASRITPAELGDMERVLRLGEVAVAQGDAGALLELNDRFHDTIIRAADNSVIAKIMVTLRQRIRWYFSAVVVTRAVGSWAQHEEIYAALCDGDGERAALRMTEHVAQTGRTIQRSASGKTPMEHVPYE